MPHWPCVDSAHAFESGTSQPFPVFHSDSVCGLSNVERKSDCSE